MTASIVADAKAFFIIRYLSGLLDRPVEQVDEWVRFGLWVGLAFAGVHLLTMLLTRWGDNRASTKALAFSAFVHVACLAALAFLTRSEVSLASIIKPDERELDVRIVSDERAEPSEQGNTPIWEKIPTADPEFARENRLPVDSTPLEGPERTPDELTRPDVKLPDAPIPPDEEVVTPRPDTQGTPARREVAAIPLEIESIEAENRPDVRIAPAPRVREKIVRSGSDDVEVERDRERGSVDIVRREYDPSRSVASLDGPNNPVADLKRREDADEINPRKGPAPQALPEENLGTPDTEPSRNSEGGAPRPERLSMKDRASRDAAVDGSLERERPERTPSVNSVESLRPVRVRDEIDTLVPRPGPTPSVIRPNFDPERLRKRVTGPTTYEQRTNENRHETALKRGGTEGSEQAVAKGLRWLATHQSREGYWDADRFGSGLVRTDENNTDRLNAGRHADAGVTALALLAFMGAGNTPDEGPYSDNVDRAIKWMIAQQQANGSLAGNATHYARMYCHGMATYALAEACGMQSDLTIDPGMVAALKKAVAYTLSQQNEKDGGWRYIHTQESDMSMFGWHMMALKSAEIAGVPIENETREELIEFLRVRSRGDKQGLASYRPGFPIDKVMTAEALFCKQLLGIRRDNPASLEAVEYITARPPRRTEYDLYYWYYGTLAMYHQGGEQWDDWNKTLRELLIFEQERFGDETGSWAPRGRWGRYGGRVYSTAMATLCLEVYYRASHLK